MRRNILIVLFAVCLIFAATAFAADYGGTSDQSMGTTRGAQARAENIIKADDLTGKTVQDRSDKEIGKIDSVALDTTTGTAYALVSVDNKLHPVPINALKKMQDKYTLNMDKNKLTQSPSVNKDNMSQDMASRNFDTKVYRFFGMAPPWGASRR